MRLSKEFHIKMEKLAKEKFVSIDDFFSNLKDEYMFIPIWRYDFHLFARYAEKCGYRLDESEKRCINPINAAWVDKEKKTFEWAFKGFHGQQFPTVEFNYVKKINNLKRKATDNVYSVDQSIESMKLFIDLIDKATTTIDETFILAYYDMDQPILYVRKGFDFDSFFAKIGCQDRNIITLKKFKDIIVADDVKNYQNINGYLCDLDKGIICLMMENHGLVPDDIRLHTISRYISIYDVVYLPLNIKTIYAQSLSHRLTKGDDEVECYPYISIEEDYIDHELQINFPFINGVNLLKGRKTCIYMNPFNKINVKENANYEYIDDYALDDYLFINKEGMHCFGDKVKHVGLILGHENLLLEIPNTVKTFKGIGTADKIILHSNYKELFKDNCLLHGYKPTGYDGCSVNEIIFSDDVEEIDVDFLKNHVLGYENTLPRLNYEIKKITYLGSIKSIKGDITSLSYQWGSPYGKKTFINIPIFFNDEQQVK